MPIFILFLSIERFMCATFTEDANRHLKIEGDARNSVHRKRWKKLKAKEQVEGYQEVKAHKQEVPRTKKNAYKKEREEDQKEEGKKAKDEKGIKGKSLRERGRERENVKKEKEEKERGRERDRENRRSYKMRVEESKLLYDSFKEKQKSWQRVAEKSEKEGEHTIATQEKR